MESTNVASITVNGSYEQMTAVNEAAAKWIETEGYKLAGPMFNIYHVSPAMEADLISGLQKFVIQLNEDKEKGIIYMSFSL